MRLSAVSIRRWAPSLSDDGLARPRAEHGLARPRAEHALARPRAEHALARPRAEHALRALASARNETPHSSVDKRLRCGLTNP